MKDLGLRVVSFRGFLDFRWVGFGFYVWEVFKVC